MILTFIFGAVVGAIVFALVLKNNPKLQNYFNLISDKTEKIIEEKTKRNI